MTWFNNAAPAGALQFAVVNTIAGATVTIYADGVLIGAATAVGTTTTIVTNGAMSLADGVHSITARQVVAGTGQSIDSPAMMLTVDTTPPTVQLSGAASGATPVDSVTLTFSEPAYGLMLSNFQLTRDGAAVPWTAGPTLTTADQVTWTLAGLGSLTAIPGNYQLTLVATPAISDAAGNGLSASASATWILLAGTTTTLTGEGPEPSNATQPLTFIATVSGGVPDSETVTLVDASNNNAVVATGTLAGGSATLTVPAGTLSVGTHNLIAAYAGDANFAASKSAAYAQVVQAAPPTLVGAPVINGDDPNGLFNASGQTTPGVQRSMVEDIVYTFNEPVVINNANQAFTVQVAGSMGIVPPTLYASAVPGSNGTQWAVSLTGQPVGVLASIANGEYRIQINPSAVFAAADGTTALNAGRTDKFYRLFGDAQGTESVNTLDYARFKQALSNYNPMFDFDGNGSVSTLDYARFKQDLAVSYAGDGFVTTI